MLAIVLINFKNEDITISFIKNELAKVNISHKVFVVNNASTNGTDSVLVEQLNGFLICDNYENIDKSYPIYIISSKENLGFAKGNNLAVEVAISLFEFRYFLFTNNDIIIDSKLVVERLISKLEMNDEIGLIGPEVIGLDNKRQSPEPYLSFWCKYFWMFWLTPFLNKRWKRKLFKLDYSEFAKEGYHYKIMGSFFIVKKASFIECGMMDPNTFLFAEEIILSDRLLHINKKCYFYPDVKVIHTHSQTIGKYINNIHRNLIKFESEAYYYNRYRGVYSFSIFLLRSSFKLYCLLKS